jgi:hypothetical protein
MNQESIQIIALNIIASNKDLTEEFMDRQAFGFGKKTEPKESPSQAEEAEMSAPEILKKRVLNASAKVEAYYSALKSVQDEVAKYQEKQMEQFNIPKLQEEYSKVISFIKDAIRALPQHEALIESMVYTLREASERNVVAPKSIDAMNDVISKINAMVKPSKLKAWEELKLQLFKMEDVKEGWSEYLQTEQKKRPKELQEPNWEAMAPEDLKKLLGPRSSLKVAASAWDTLKAWFNELKSLFSITLGSIESDNAQWEEINQELHAIA